MIGTANTWGIVGKSSMLRLVLARFFAIGSFLIGLFAIGLFAIGWSFATPLHAADSDPVETLESLETDRNMRVFEPKSPNSNTIAEVTYLLIGIQAVIFLLVGIPLCIILCRYRHRKADDGIEPPQVYGSNPIEVAWTVGPAITVFVIFLVTTRSIYEIRAAPAPPEAVHVRVVGHQWWWEYEYLEKNESGYTSLFTTANEMRVPLSEEGTPRPVYLDLESADVMHSFWVPQLAGKTDLIPGRVNHMWFQPEHAGWYTGQCAEYCGTQHAHMWLRVKAENKEDFDKWVANERKDAVTDPTVAAGRTLFLTNACVNCHTIKGTPARGQVGPDLTHLMTRKTLASGIIPNTKKYLLQWLRDPDSIKPGCNMPQMKLTDDDYNKILDYLLTLK